MDKKNNINTDYYDDDTYNITESLKRQVNEQLDEEEKESIRQHTTSTMNNRNVKKKRKKKKKYKGLKIFGSILLVFVLLVGFMIGTTPGRSVLSSLAGAYISNNVNQDTEAAEIVWASDGDILGRKEDYVTNVLLLGIEEIGGARNTDSMIIVSVNTQDNTVKLTSLMRDSYVNVPGWKKTKLNAAYAHGGIQLLKETIEQNYKIHLDGYGSVDFDSFESIIDTLGGIDIQLGAKEADYLNTTNYITKKSNRKMKEGVNHMNGDQALGYCRVRKVATYDGVNNDFGRTLRQRRVLNAIFDKFKSKNVFTMVSVMNECMSYVTTSLSTNQIQKLLFDMMDNKIATMDMLRVPVDGAYEAPSSYEGVTWPIVLDWNTNIKEMYKFIYGDTEEEAAQNLSLF